MVAALCDSFVTSRKELIESAAAVLGEAWLAGRQSVPVFLMQPVEGRVQANAFARSAQRRDKALY
jgi:hypothetical protein